MSDAGAHKGQRRGGAGKMALEGGVLGTRRHCRDWKQSCGPCTPQCSAMTSCTACAALHVLCCAALQSLGIELDESRNVATVGGHQGDISGPGAKIRSLVVPTDEELSIAKQTIDVVSKLTGIQSLDF